MNKLFLYRQNNSGGSFKYPSVFVYVEAENEEQSKENVSEYFDLCGNSGTYAEYDYCGCCPCCGHRWDGCEEESIQQAITEINKENLQYMGTTASSLIKSDKSIVIGDTKENLSEILNYLETWKKQ